MRMNICHAKQPRQIAEGLDSLARVSSRQFQSHAYEYAMQVIQRCQAGSDAQNEGAAEERELRAIGSGSQERMRRGSHGSVDQDLAS